MNITNSSFSILDYKQDCFRIQTSGDLKAAVTEEIRAAIQACATLDYPAIYLDASSADEIDIAGINEVINAHYTLQQESKKLVFVYRKNSGVEKWVETTRLDKFIATAIVA